MNTHVHARANHPVSGMHGYLSDGWMPSPTAAINWSGVVAKEARLAVRVLLDECLPKRLKGNMVGRDAKRAN